MAQYVLALDQGTTSSRAILFDKQAHLIAIAQQEFPQHFPKPGWVEHDPDEILRSQLATIDEVLQKAAITKSDIAAIGITNQRETTIIWDRHSGRPICNALVWQDRRTAKICEDLKRKGFEEIILSKTGLILDAYFSASKIKWILDTVPGARQRAEKGELAFGTVDSWLVWNLTGGKRHITEPSNASRTMLFNIHSLQWDEELLRIFNVPSSILPEVLDSSQIYADYDGIPISGIAGDQQAALFGQGCFESGMAKNTYGTGCFMLMNTGTQIITSKNKLLTSVAWKIGKEVTYALEGSIFVAGAVVQWLRDGMKVIQSSAEIENLARDVDTSDGVYFVPAFTGLGAPYWDPDAKGIICGLTRGSTSGHIARAALEAIAFQVTDVLEAMNSDTGLILKELRVDGGACRNDLLMQFQADLLNTPVLRPEIVESTALGAAFLAGLAVGFWKDADQLAELGQNAQRFEPAGNLSAVANLRTGWKDAVRRSRSSAN